MYSQREEEKHILKACASAENRRFLDIGAWHAIELSNTRALFEAGWGGVLIEPSPGPVRGLVQEYGNCDRVHVMAAAVVGGPETWWRSLAITDDAVSTSSNEGYAKWKDRGGFIGRLLVPTVTIEQILSSFGSFDFVSIDTEGTSVDLFKQVLATEMFPQCICAEYDDRLAEAQMAAHDRGYRTLYVSQENLVVARG